MQHLIFLSFCIFLLSSSSSVIPLFFVFFLNIIFLFFFHALHLLSFISFSLMGLAQLLVGNAGFVHPEPAGYVWSCLRVEMVPPWQFLDWIKLNACAHTQSLMQSWTNAAAAAAQQPRRTTVRSEFTVGTSLLVSSCFGLSVGLDGSYKPLVGRRQCFTDACVFLCMSSAQPHSTAFKCVGQWEVCCCCCFLVFFCYGF